MNESIMQRNREPTGYSIGVDLANNQQLYYIFANIAVKCRPPFMCDLDFVMNRNIDEGEQLQFL